MSELVIDQFPDFFQAITGYEADTGFDSAKGYPPFRWQERLARTVAEEGWPDVLDLPTASGKTATLEIAIFALALEADRSPTERKAPRRIFFVVDRRVVVDQAYERAARIANALETALLDESSSPVVRTVAESLKRLAGPGSAPVGHRRLRGGVPRTNAWTRSPSQPAIIACTVDQLGSRLLFRGYGVSPRMAPIDAGLVGNDALILLDEAHCARPFLETIQAVQQYREWAERTIVLSPFRFVSLSATPDLDDTGVGTTLEIFRLTEEEREDPGLRQRLTTSKLAALTVAKQAKVPRGGGWEEVRKAREKLASELSRQALAFLEDGSKKRVAVMVNRVATALKVREEIENARKEDTAFDVVLMTGRMRPLDRDDLISRWQNRLQATDHRSEEDRSVVVVSTQSLEVGADFDFDALVTEAASLDALRQRFGRLDRLGHVGTVSAVVLIARYQEKNSEEDPVYGASLANTWQWLTSLSGKESDFDGELDLWPGLTRHDVVEVVDFGIEALERHIAAAKLEELRAPAPHAPVMLPVHMDRWAQTSPIPIPDPDPAVFLHGGEPVTPEVNLLWRLDLSQEADESDIVETLSLCPPSAVESLPVSIGWVRRWLRGELTVPEGESDVEGRGEGVEQPDATQRDLHRPSLKVPRIAIWRGRDDSLVTDDPYHIRPGDYVVILNPSKGKPDLGPFESLLRSDRSLPPAVDLGDRAQLAARGRAILRLHPGLMANWSPELVSEELRGEIEELLARPYEDLSRSHEEVRALLTRMLEEWPEPSARVSPYGWLKDVFAALLEVGFTIEAHPITIARSTANTLDASGGLILRGRRKVAPPTEGLKPVSPFGAEETIDQDASDRRTEADHRVLLDGHLQGVEETVVALAEHCGLSEELVADLSLAARLHDIGKADERFQAMLYGDGLRHGRTEEEPLAKSPEFPTSWWAFRRLAEIAGLPSGFRHELVSLRLVGTDRNLLGEAHDPDLVLHLIAAHHGHCRPFAPVVMDDNPVSVTWKHDGRQLEATSATGLERVGSGVAERFWKLVRRYGWWGLAYLEAILRKADHQRSAFEEIGPQGVETAEVEMAGRGVS